MQLITKTTETFSTFTQKGFSISNSFSKLNQRQASVSKLKNCSHRNEHSEWRTLSKLFKLKKKFIIITSPFPLVFYPFRQRSTFLKFSKNTNKILSAQNKQTNFYILFFFKSMIYVSSEMLCMFCVKFGFLQMIL